MKLGQWMSIIGILAGVWVWVAPYAVGFAPTHGNPWGGSILGSALLGTLITLVSLAGLVGFWGLRLKELSDSQMADE